MIIDPDMPDHWKVQMLAGTLGDDPAAPVYLIRLWGHCQNRKKCTFDKLPPMALRAICKYPGDANEFDQALADCDFISRDGDAVEIKGWAEHNSKMIAAWENGKAGGRPSHQEPKKNPKQNPPETEQETHQEPGDNPSDGSGNPQESGKGGKGGEVGKRGEVGEGGKGAPTGAPPKPNKNRVTRPDDIDEQVWSDMLALRRGKKAALTPTAWETIRKELDEGVAMGYDINELMAEWVAAGWQALKLEWYLKRTGKTGNQPGESSSERAAREAVEWREARQAGGAR